MPTPVGEVPVSRFDSIEDTIAAFSAYPLFPGLQRPKTHPALLQLVLTRSLENGEFIVVLDDPSRENEGDLIIAAERITDEQMAFLVRYTSGLVCAPAAPSILEKLDLPQMVTNNADPKGTAYTVSIDANHESTTTGISAQDRALTCRMLAAPDAKRDDLRSPGHVLPLRAREGGVRVRPGHTEAAVEFCRLSGLQQVAVIAELVEDGEAVEGQAVFKNPGMMRTEGCLAFGKKFGLKVCTIEALVAYVEKREGKYTNGSA